MVRNGALDILKIVMALMVVGLHIGFLSDVSQLAGYLTSNGLFRIAVPVFLIINGYFFYRTTVSGTQMQWFRRVMLLYVIWMGVYSPYWFPDFHDGLISFAKNFGRTVFFGYYHLWYLSGMIGAAFMLSIVTKAGVRITLVAVAVTFCVGVLIQYAGSYGLVVDSRVAKILSQNWSHRNFLFFSFPFFCAGYLINRYQLLERIHTRTAVLLLFAGLILLMLEAGVNFYISSGKLGFDNLVALAVIAPAIFALFFKLKITIEHKGLALYSTGIYLVHVLMIFWIEQLLPIRPTALTATVALAATVASWGLIKASKKLPYLL